MFWSYVHPCDRPESLRGDWIDEEEEDAAELPNSQPELDPDLDTSEPDLPGPDASEPDESEPGSSDSEEGGSSDGYSSDSIFERF